MPVVSVELPDDQVAVQSRIQRALRYSCFSERVPGSEPKRVQFNMLEQDAADFRCRPRGEVAREVFIPKNCLAHQLSAGGRQWIKRTLWALSRNGLSLLELLPN